MPYDTITAVTDDLNDNLASYQNEKKTAIEHVMSASAYAAYTRTQSMTGNVTLTDSDLPIQSFSPTAARDLTLPTVATTNHAFFVFNRSGSYAITIKNASAVVIAVLQPYSHVTLKSDGANLWSVAATSERETAYKITPTVSANDLILTLTHMDGTTPSTSRPLWFRIGSTWRSVVAALTRTLADGTNWGNAGAPELGGKAIDWFPYVVWDSNSSAVGLTYSRIPYARLVSDFSSTTTNEKYCAGYSDFTSTDEVECIGRFEATLSLVATSYLWTVPTYTNLNLIQSKIDYTRDLDFANVWTNLTVGNATLYAKYNIHGRKAFVRIGIVLGSTSSVGTAPSVLLPFFPSTLGTTFEHFGEVIIRDTGTALFNGTAYLISGAFYPQILKTGSTYSTPDNLSATIPMTWASTDEMMIVANYVIG